MLTGGIGDAGTQSVILNVAGATPPTQATVLGGTAQGPGYTLTQAEAALIRADALRVNAPAVGTSATRNPDLIIRDLSFNGGGAATGIGTLTIATPGIAQVQGNLLLAGARATDGITFNAAQRLEVVTPNGSIRVRNASGAPGGTLALSSNDIWAVNQNLLDKLHTDPAYVARDSDLANNGGSQAPRGYIEGNTVTLTTANSLFVQNTGANPTGTFSLTGPAFGGVTVGPGGLNIRSAGTSPASVTAFGSRINADGSVTIGYDFFFAVNFQAGAASAGSPTGYTAASTFNTCVIATGQCALRRPADTGPGGRDPIVGPPGTIQLPPGMDDDNVDTSFATEPLIEEPVTSGGESTLWAPPCDPSAGSALRRRPSVIGPRLLLALALLAAAAAPASAARSLSVRDNFRIGSGGSVLCSAESQTNGPALIDMFDRGYSMLCRDAAAPVGQLFVLRARGGDPVARLAAIRNERVACAAAPATEIEGVGRVETLDCRLNSGDVTYRVYLHRARGAVYVAEGLGGYDSALRLALRSLVADREVPGEVSIATTGAGDPAAFARAQAGTLDPQRALAEAYRRNNAGSYAESSEYFAELTQRGDGSINRAEALVNEALQKSNLGRYAEAETLFSQAMGMAGADPVTARRIRNYEAMHLLNQGLAGAALEQLSRPMPPISAGRCDPHPRHRSADRRPAQRRIAGREPVARAGRSQPSRQGTDTRRPGTASARHDPAPAAPRCRGGRALQ